MGKIWLYCSEPWQKNNKSDFKNSGTKTYIKVSLAKKVMGKKNIFIPPSQHWHTSRTHGHVSSTDTSHKQDPARAHMTTHHCWLAAADAGLSIKQVTNCHESSFFSRQKLAEEKLLITFIVTQFPAASSGPGQYSASQQHLPHYKHLAAAAITQGDLWELQTDFRAVIIRCREVRSIFR